MTKNVVLVVGGTMAPDRTLDVTPHDIAAGVDPAEALVLAADSGVQFASELGWTPDHIVGDLDSVDPDALHQMLEAGAHLHRFAADKDATDIELALDLIDELSGVVPDPAPPRPQLTVVGPGGGRLDHLIADLALLSSSRLNRFDVTAHFAAATTTVVSPGETRTVAGSRGEVVSLVPMHGIARGITTSGLRWPLVDADLHPGTTRGISNAFLGDEAQVSLERGALLVIRPGVMSGPVTPRTTPYDPSPRAPD